MTSMRHLGACLAVGAVVAVGCGGPAGVASEEPPAAEESAVANEGAGSDETGVVAGDSAVVPVQGTDRVEVRMVASPEQRSSDDAAADPGVKRHLTPFGRYAVTVGSIEDDTLDELLAVVVDATYLDTGDITYDLANPDYELIFLRNGEELARLGHYTQPSGVGTRWMDEDWVLLDMSFTLPAVILSQ